MSQSEKNTATHFSRKKVYTSVVAVLFLAAGAVFLGGPGGIKPNLRMDCPANPALGKLRELSKGEVAAFTSSLRPEAFPDLSFKDKDGNEKTLSSFKGKTVLLNLWATWCVPCRKEMPSLDKLQAELGSDKFEVVAVSLDTSSAEKPKQWLEDNNIKNLAFYADDSGTILKTLQKSGHVVGLPTTILLDTAGCQAGILKGGAEWASEDAFNLIRGAL
ncbi:TlpA disulfide reductase family protein [Microvirga sp. W0021]|uniref:TlpA disulfide reductase family protein n=1 Tax=Hohaiivirga grylli TaxID=3133970 RepID=A0ABV0BLA6_9HYPH